MSSVILWVGAGILLLPRSLGVVGVGLGTILLVCFGRMYSSSLLSIASSLRPLLLHLEGDLQVHKGEDLCWNGFGSLWKRIWCVHRSFPCMLRSMEGIE